MNDAYTYFLQNLNVFLLVFVRVTGLFVIAPVFGRRNIPLYYKIGFSFFLVLIALNTIQLGSVPEISSIWAYTGLVIKEFIVGIMIGYVGFIIFTAIYMAGQFIDMQVGFGMVSVIDPSSNLQVPISANFYYTITLLLFFIVNGHHMIIRALIESFTLVPIGSAIFGTDVMNDLLRIFAYIFIVGFKISIPIVMVVFLVDVILGILTKTVPQLNIFVVGIPLKIIIGLIFMALTIPAFSYVANSIFKDIDNETYIILKHLGGNI